MALKSQPAKHFGYRNIQVLKQSPLGVGSFGAVYRAKCDELPCVAKVLHPTLIDPRDPGARKILERFEQECEFLNSIRHPYIVQYLGVTWDHESRLPVLLMELMDENLTQFLEQSPKPLTHHIQVDLCYDIALALAYLHSNGIVHRDLSSNNVLLIAGSRAKVTDFGMSKFMDANRRMTPLTMCPGTTVYMSPEALKEPPSYTEKLDCFSHGVLTIQIITRQFPEPGERMKTVPDPRSPTGTTEMPVLETERRKSHLALIESTHPLLQNAIECLNYNEKDRPLAGELCHRLSTAKESAWYSESLQQQTRRQQLQDNTQEQSENENQQLKQQLMTATTQFQRQMEVKDHQIAELQHKLQQMVVIPNGSHCLEDTDSLHPGRKALLESRTIARDSLPICQSQAVDTDPIELNLSMQGFGKAAPCKMTRGAVAVGGDTAYFRAGRSALVYAFNLAMEEWFTLPECPNDRFTIAMINGLLTAIGGMHGDQFTNALLSLIGEGSNKTWSEHFPPMPTKRYKVASVSTEHALIVAGGATKHSHFLTGLCNVEVMNTDVLQWSVVASLPHPFMVASATICGDNLYMLGAKTQNGRSKEVLTCSVSNLLQSTQSESQYESLSMSILERSVWRKIAKVPVYWATCTTARGKLLAIGGENSDKSSSNTVYVYNNATDSWDIITYMSVGRSYPMVATLPRNKVMIVGGFTNPLRKTDTVEFAIFL